MMRSQFRDIIAAIAVGALVASCSATPYSMRSMPDRFDSTCTPALAHSTTMAVEDFRPACTLDNTTFQLYDPATRKVTYEKCYRWNNTPLRLINNVVRQTLVNAAPFSKRVNVIPAGNSAALLMTGEITSMRIIASDDEPERAEVSFHVRVVRTGVTGLSAAPIIDGTYSGEGDVAMKCLQKVPEAMDDAIADALGRLLTDLCKELKDVSVPARDRHVVTTNEPCIRVCAFRLDGDSVNNQQRSSGKIGMEIFDKEGDVVERIDMMELTAGPRGEYFTAATTGASPGLNIRIEFPERGKKVFMRISGLLRGPVELPVTLETADGVKGWMKGHVKATQAP